MILEVLSNNHNATNQILMGLKRRTTKLKEIDDEICKEVAQELGFEFEKTEEGNLSFKDKICS